MPKKKVAPSSLNPKQEIFVARLAAGDSQREAYIKAYGRGKSSDASIDSRACTLAKNSKVKARLSELRQKATEKIEGHAIKDAQSIIKSYTDIVSASITDYVNVIDVPGGGLAILPKDLAKIPQDKLRCIKKMTVDSNGNMVLELVDKIPALQKLSEIYEVVQPKDEQQTVNIILGNAKEYAE